MRLPADASAHLGALTGSCLVGAAVVATRSAVDEIEPFSLAFLRYMQGAVILIVVLAFAAREDFLPNRRDLREYVALGLLMFALFPVLFNSALRYTTASRGAVILATMPLWGALIARRFGSERLRIEQVAGVLCSFAGVVVVFAESGLGGSGGQRVAFGNLLMVGSAVAGGLYAVIARPVMRRGAPLKATAYAMLAGSAVLAIPAFAEGLVDSVRDASRNTILLVLYLGIFGGAIAFWLFAYSLSRLTPTQALVYINLNPVVATLLAALFLDESLSPTFAIGFALVAFGLVLTNMPGKQQVRPDPA